MLTASDLYPSLQKVWVHATKMRAWLNAKRASISNKYRATKNDNDRETQEESHIAQIYSHVKAKAEYLIQLEPSKRQARPTTDKAKVAYQL